jgi:serine/threonine-protein kinase
MDNAMDRYLGKVLDGRYEIAEVIGYGGMAMVYKALCNVLNRNVAVKILKDEYARDDEFREHFKAESQAVAKLAHPNIVAVYDYSKLPDCQYIVMELLEGITLKQYMEKKGPLSCKEALHFATQTAKALSHAHEKGIIHRDIKPQNIMVGKDGNIKVADFGIAYLQNESAPESSETMGSIHYISPEQARGEKIDARSDIYSLGVVMYEMLTGALPYEGDTVEAVAVQHFGPSPAFPGDINPDIPGRLEQITMKAMTSDLNYRYQSANELLNDLEDFRKQQFSTEAEPEEPEEEEEVYEVASESVAAKFFKRAAELPDRDYKRRKVRSRKVSNLLGYLLVILFLIGIVAFLRNYWLDDLFSDPERVTIPNFVGQNFEEIFDSEAFSLFNFKVVTYEVNPDYPEGTIISQEPEAQRRIAPGSDGIDMEFVVSTGILMVEVPDVVNLEYRQATTMLQKLGFTVVTEIVASTDITEDYVVSTSPAAGDKMPSGSTIYVSVSGGPVVDEFPMPNLVGRARDSAIVSITELRLELGTITEINDEATAGTVIWQNINAGEMVKRGTMIYLTVSLGPKEEPSEEPSEQPSEEPTNSVEPPPPVESTPVDPPTPVDPVTPPDNQQTG